MGRAKLLIENFVFFGLIRISSALLPFFILPIILSYLTDPKDFGIYDNFIVIVGVFANLATLGSTDAIFRQFYKSEDESYRKNILKTAGAIVLLSSAICAFVAFLLMDSLASMFFGDEGLSKLVYIVCVFLIVQTSAATLLNPSRVLNRKRELLIYTLLNAVCFYSISLILLELEFSYYSLIFGQLSALVVSGLYAASINKDYFRAGVFSKSIAKELLAVGLPLVPIFVIYWANNAMVRVFIVNNLGQDQAGIFALGSKYAAVSSLLQAAFSGGWSFFTFSTMLDADQVAMKSKIFEYLTALIAVFSIAISLAAYPFFTFFFQEQYQRAYSVFPLLLFAPLILMLYQIVANQFTIIAKSYMSLIALFIGLLANLSVCYYAVNESQSLEMASASIPIGYLISLVVVVLLALKQKIFSISLRSCINLSVAVLFLIILYFLTNIVWISALVLLSTIAFVNAGIVKESFQKIKAIVSSYRK